MFRTLLRTGLALALAVPMLASAQDAPPPPPPLPGTLVVEGLAAPRGLAFDAAGNLLIADAGTGGEAVFESPALDNPETMNPIQFGMTGSVVQLAADGTVGAWVSGLPSYAAPTETTGVYRAIPNGESVWLVVSSTPHKGGYWGSSVVQLDAATQTVQRVINLTAYEVANNPDGNEIDSNVADIAWGADGTLYIVDAGANTLYAWTAADGLSVVQSWPENSVPDAIEIAENGDVYIGFLGAGIAPGAGKIERWAAGELAETFSGLNGVTDILLAADGTLYAVELANFAEGPISGRVVSVSADGVVPVAAGLNAPFAIAQDAAGDLYVTIGTLFFGPGLPSGVLKLDQ